MRGLGSSPQVRASQSRRSHGEFEQETPGEIRPGVIGRLGLRVGIFVAGWVASGAESLPPAPPTGAEASLPVPVADQCTAMPPAAESLPDSYVIRTPKPLDRRFDPIVPQEDLGPDNSYGGYDLWMTKQKGDGSWTCRSISGGTSARRSPNCRRP